MIIIKQQRLLTEYLNKHRASGLQTGFVPTMGALHAGHLKLIDMAARQSDLTVCSIFINPTQFNDPDDYIRYPRKTETDIRLLEPSATDIVFMPQPEDVYPTGTAALEKYNIGPLETILEGQYRPGHFQGVCQVMHRLLQMVQPQLLFMGQKDYQQCMVVEQLIRLLQLPVRLIRCPTLRDPDGLAMSSRNQRLSEEQRAVAPAVFHALTRMKEQLASASISAIKKEAQTFLGQKGFSVDYVEVADADTLDRIHQRVPGRSCVALIAAFLGEVRLIDNMVLC